MERLRKTLILLFVAGIPAAAPPLLAPSPNLCFTAGPVTYQLAPNAWSPDYRVKIDNGALHPDLRIGLVDRAETADFTVVDDVPGTGSNACKTAGDLKVVKLVGTDAASDVTIRVSREAEGADFTLFVHSARVSHQDAAALFALMRHAQNAGKVAEYR